MDAYGPSAEALDLLRGFGCLRPCGSSKLGKASKGGESEFRTRSLQAFDEARELRRSELPNDSHHCFDGGSRLLPLPLSFFPSTLLLCEPRLPFAFLALTVSLLRCSSAFRCFTGFTLPLRLQLLRCPSGLALAFGLFLRRATSLFGPLLGRSRLARTLRFGGMLSRLLLRRVRVRPRRGMALEHEIRNPRTEIRRKAEIRPKLHLALAGCDFGFPSRFTFHVSPWGSP